jgi:hypothetical protein
MPEEWHTAQPLTAVSHILMLTHLKMTLLLARVTATLTRSKTIQTQTAYNGLTVGTLNFLHLQRTGLWGDYNKMRHHILLLHAAEHSHASFPIEVISIIRGHAWWKMLFPAWWLYWMCTSPYLVLCTMTGLIWHYWSTLRAALWEQWNNAVLSLWWQER